MKRKYKLLIIILISALLAYFIYFFNNENKINLVALGDGIASGETPYNIDGISYNDYVEEYFQGKKILKKYNNTYAIKNYKLDSLTEDLKSNVKNKRDELNIQQLIHKANLITLNIGEEELTTLASDNDLDKDSIKEFIGKYDDLLFLIKDITEAKIVLISFYENKYLDKSNIIILNSELANVAIKYDCIFININDLLYNKDYFLNSNSIYFNYKAHKEIAEMIIHSL